MEMMRSEPSRGDFVVEYTDASRRRDAARVVIVHLTSDAGPEEVYWSRLPQAGTQAERLAATWALEDGTCAWRLSGADTEDAVLTGITTDVVAAGTVAFHKVDSPSRSPTC
jgi:hypothetical protein